VESISVLSIIQAAGAVLLSAASVLVLCIVRQSDTAEEAPPEPASAVRPDAADDELRRAA
jgi:hypothetical protein